MAELLALAVHELRTPVTVVGGYLRMLARGQVGPLDDRQRRIVEESERSCARLAALVAELSELAGLDSGTVTLASQSVPFAPMLEDALSGVTEGRERGVTVELHGPRHNGTVVGDRARLTTALAALVAAVVREQTSPGPVTVRVSIGGGDGRLVAAIGIGQDASLEAPPADARLNELRGGLGLALPIARRVIDRHGGRVWSSGHERHIGSVGVLLPLEGDRS